MYVYRSIYVAHERNGIAAWRKNLGKRFFFFSVREILLYIGLTDRARVYAETHTRVYNIRRCGGERERERYFSAL